MREEVLDPSAFASRIYGTVSRWGSYAVLGEGWRSMLLLYTYMCVYFIFVIISIVLLLV